MEMGVVWVWVWVWVWVLLLLLLSLLLLLMWVKRRVVPVGRWNTQVNTLRLAWQGSHPSMPLWLYGLP